MTAIKISFFAYYFLKLYLDNFSKINGHKEIKVFLTIFA